MPSINFELSVFTQQLLHIGIAFVLPILTAIERESEARSAGLRTFPLVSVAACGFTMLAGTVFESPDAQAKVMAGIITGIGFIGGGAILKSGDNVKGTSTAAAIWATGAMGIAVGLGKLEIALCLSIVTLVSFLVLGGLKSNNQ